MAKFEKVLTEVPLLDEIMYNCRLIINDGVVLKDQVEADSYETVSSVRDSDLYLASIDGHISFGLYKYSREDIAVISSITNQDVDNWAGDNSLIPEVYRPLLMRNAQAKYIANYVEENRYFRTLNGLPTLTPDMLENGKNVPADDAVMPEDVAIPNTIIEYVDMNLPLHAQNKDVRLALESSGVFEQAMSKYNAKYLMYAGKRSVSIYDARKADKFAPLYIPSEGIEQRIRDNFESVLDKNRIIYLRSYYDEAYDYKSDYYDKFMIIMIILQTVTDMITMMPEYYIRKDLFDIRTIEYYFGANGVQFFPDIPIRYQISLVRNLNRLIKYKSSDQCIQEIAKLFGFDNIEIYKYHILRSRKVNGDGKYSFEKYNDEGGNLVDDVEKNFDVKFIKVPLNGLVDDAIKNRTNIMEYNNVTADDIYWDGENEHHTVRKHILDYEFNMLRTKYITINSVYSMQEYMFQMTYFMNMLFNNNLDKELLKFNIPYLSVDATLVDSFVFMYALAHIYYGTEDVIIDSVEDALKIFGFNFDADMAELSNYLAENHVTAEELGIAGFEIPSSGFFTFNQLMYVYTQNKGIYDHVVHEMLNANNKRIYRIYKHIYDALMLSDLNQSYFTLPDGGLASSFKEFLSYKNVPLYNKFKEYEDIKEKDKRDAQIATVVYNVACTIEEYLDMDKLKFIFTGLPAASIESVKIYVMDVIKFFKSFKVDVLDINTVYRADDKLQNTIIIMDDWAITDVYEPHEIMPYQDRFVNQRNTSTFHDKAEILDTQHISQRIYERRNSVRIKSDDKPADILVKTKPTECIFTKNDKIAGKTYVYDWRIDMIPTEVLHITPILNPHDKCQIIDKMYMKYVYD